MNKKITFLLLNFLVIGWSYGQIFITEIADPDGAVGARFVELFNAGSSDVDLSTGWKINRYTNGNTTPQSPKDLTGIIPAHGFYIVCANQSEFNATYGFDADQELGTGGPADSNGDDQIFIIDPNDNVVDIFGVPGEDGSNTCHEFEDGRVERRASVTSGNNGTWNEENWNVWSDESTASGCTYHFSNEPQTAPNDFDPKQWIGYTPANTIVAFSSVNSSISEDGNSIDICVSITNPDPNTATEVEISLDNTSTATNGTDYSNISFPVIITFPAGSNAEQCLTLTITDDSEAELDETIVLNLQNPSGGNAAELGTVSQHVLKILDNDIICPNIGDIIFTEIMQNPAAVADNMGEWFEIYNTTNDDIDLFGLKIVDDNHPVEVEGFTIDTHLTLPANGYLLFANNGDSSTNGGLPTPDYVYDPSLTLGNGTDGITIQCSGEIIDAVVWDDGDTFPDPSGKSMSLKDGAYNATDNDNGANWEEATVTYGDGDYGTPGSANTVSVEDNHINGFSLYPNPIDNGNITITSKSNNLKNISIFDVTGKQIFAKTFYGTSYQINIDKYSPGIYLVKVIENKNTAVTKLIIK